MSDKDEPVSIEHLMKDAFQATGHAFGRDDPLFALAIVLGRITAQYQERQDILFEELQDRLDDTIKDWDAKARATSEAVLNAALNAGRNTLLLTMREAGEKAAEMCVARTRELFKRQERMETTIRAGEVGLAIAAAVSFVGGLLGLVGALL